MQGENYSLQLKQRFAQNGGRLFFVDGFKNRAFASVREIFTSESFQTSLCVVKSPETALQVKAALFGNGLGVEVIDSIDYFKHLYHEVSTDMQRAYEFAESFKRAYPRLIVTLNGENGEPVLHSKLFRTVGRSGEYSKGENSYYTVSDILADAGYSMIVVDDVYDMFALFEEDRDTLDDKIPQKYERIDFMGKVYFTDVLHSYKRLYRLVDSADKAIVISDCIVDRDVISFYAGASLVNGSFSYKAAKRLAKANSTSYEEEVDRMLDAIAYSKTDETIQSLCLQRAKGRAQSVPGDLDRLGEYLTGNLNFMTREETFLRAFCALSKGKSGIQNELLLDQLEDDFTLARTVCDMFFDDTLKGEIESRVEGSHIAKMNAEDISTLFDVFKKYGIYCATGELGDKCDIYRIYHEDSGFEDLVRRSSDGFDRADNALSATALGQDVSYKCIATKDLIENGKLRLPVLIVSAEKPSEVVFSLTKITKIPTHVFDFNLSRLADGISITDYSGFEAIANSLCAGSIVFFDVLSDMNLFDTYVKKAIGFSDNTNAAVLVTYDNMEGVLIDAWQESWINENQNHLAVKNSEVYIRGEKPLDYNYILSELDGVYRLYKKLIDGPERVMPKKIAEQFSSAVSGFTLGMVAHARDMEEDFEYFEKIAPLYSGVFANSVSVGNQGREVFSDKLQEQTVGRKKKKKAEYVAVPEAKRVAFNICAKQLHETCDFKNADCSKCTIRTNTVNNIEMFSECVNGYFKETVRIMTRLQEERIERQLDDTIGSQGSTTGKSDLMDIERVRDLSGDVNKIMRSLLESKPNSRIPFYGKYSDVFDIKEAIQSIHYGIFKKYYDQLMSIFEKATNEMKKSFGAVGQGAKSSLQTL